MGNIRKPFGRYTKDKKSNHTTHTHTHTHTLTHTLTHTHKENI
jgi:hypothetical protein